MPRGRKKAPPPASVPPPPAVNQLAVLQQAAASGLVVGHGDTDSAVVTWNRTDWPPLLGGWRRWHTSVVVHHSPSEQAPQTFVVVLGGTKQSEGCSSSVLVLPVPTTTPPQRPQHWRLGPSLATRRAGHAAVVCRNHVYVVGGESGFARMASLECIAIADLVSDETQAAPPPRRRRRRRGRPNSTVVPVAQHEDDDDSDSSLSSSSSSSTLTTSSTLRPGWTTLSCALTTKRLGCAAAAVLDRYLVVAGGIDQLYLSSVELVDTHTHTIYPGPALQYARCSSGMAVVDDCLYMVGGVGNGFLASVESLQLNTTNPHNSNNSTTISSIFSNPWRLQVGWTLPIPRNEHAVTRLGSCIIVAGGFEKRESPSSTVVVLDTQRRVVWELPSLSMPRFRSSLVAVAGQLVVLGGSTQASCETLPIGCQNEQQGDAITTTTGTQQQQQQQQQQQGRASSLVTHHHPDNDDNDFAPQSLLPHPHTTPKRRKRRLPLTTGTGTHAQDHAGEPNPRTGHEDPIRIPNATTTTPTTTTTRPRRHSVPPPQPMEPVRQNDNDENDEDDDEGTGGTSRTVIPLGTSTLPPPPSPPPAGGGIHPVPLEPIPLVVDEQQDQKPHAACAPHHPPPHDTTPLAGTTEGLVVERGGEATTTADASVVQRLQRVESRLDRLEQQVANLIQMVHDQESSHQHSGELVMENLIILNQQLQQGVLWNNDAPRTTNTTRTTNGNNHKTNTRDS